MPEDIRLSLEGAGQSAADDSDNTAFWENGDVLLEHERRARESGDRVVTIVFQAAREALMSHEEMLAHQAAMVDAVKQFFAQPATDGAWSEQPVTPAASRDVVTTASATLAESPDDQAMDFRDQPEPVTVAAATETVADAETETTSTLTDTPSRAGMDEDDAMRMIVPSLHRAGWLRPVAVLVI
ncbi:MAG: hypothetical protein IT440_09840, partial [Phycisphaeraceae bacterium]|nr:hypothetical protein [Phycisphaeraceae bacterium]